MKGTCGRDADWNARVLFLRSKSNPNLYLLRKWDRFHSTNADHATLYDSANLANDLLRIDLHSFFTEMAGWYLYYRKCRPAYTQPNDSPHRRRLPKLDSSKHNVFHKTRHTGKDWNRHLMLTGSKALNLSGLLFPTGMSMSTGALPSRPFPLILIQLLTELLIAIPAAVSPLLQNN